MPRRSRAAILAVFTAALLMGVAAAEGYPYSGIIRFYGTQTSGYVQMDQAFDSSLVAWGAGSRVTFSDFTWETTNYGTVGLGISAGYALLDDVDGTHFYFTVVSASPAVLSVYSPGHGELREATGASSAGWSMDVATLSVEAGTTPVVLIYKDPPGGGGGGGGGGGALPPPDGTVPGGATEPPPAPIDVGLLPALPLPESLLWLQPVWQRYGAASAGVILLVYAVAAREEEREEKLNRNLKHIKTRRRRSD